MTVAHAGGEATGRPGEETRRHILESLLVTGGALLTIGLAVVAHTVHPGLAILVSLLAAGASYVAAPGLALASILFAALFQNLFVSLVSASLSAGADFALARAYNFLLLAAVWGLAVGDHLLARRGASPATDRHLIVTGAAFAAIVLYFGLGLGLGAKPMAAVTYLRNIASALMLYQASLIVASRHRLRLQTVFAMAGGLIVVFGYTELLYRGTWIEMTGGEIFWPLSMEGENATAMWDMQALDGGKVILGLVDSFRINLFNTPLLADLGITALRMFGPNMHAISYAYGLAFLSVFAVFTGRLVLSALVLPLLVAANVKGAVIAVIVSVMGWAAARLFGHRFAFGCIVALLTLYAAVGIVLGQRIGDYHVLGLMGGLYNFAAFPLGRGLGFGGNLAIDFSTLDWSAYQAAGRTPVAMESAVGVLLYQMGVAAFLLIGCYAWLAWRTVLIAERTLAPLHAAVAFMLLTVVFNGLFQEEALFAPLGVGLPMMLCGLIHGATFRNARL